MIRSLPCEAHPAAYVLAAVIANVVTGSVAVPGDVLKSHMQLGSYRHMFHAVSSIIRKQGPQALYTGFGMSMVKAVPNYAFRYGIYEQVRDMYSQWRKRKTHGAENVLVGCLTGSASTLVTAPIDTLRTRLIAQPAGVKKVLMCMLAEEGPFSLYKGLTLRLSYMIPSSFLFYYTYESVRKQLRQRSLEQ
mmetsp:Transcript_118/g.214  ORF Transcript_118/g.214 Transcript_118/m.214 type:complete len:190 (+) Transcript_118:43-612(+)